MADSPVVYDTDDGVGWTGKQAIALIREVGTLQTLEIYGIAIRAIGTDLYARILVQLQVVIRREMLVALITIAGIEFT